MGQLDSTCTQPHLGPRHLELAEEPHVRSAPHFILEALGDEEVKPAHQGVAVQVCVWN
jgi:hypothetical protein